MMKDRPPSAPLRRTLTWAMIDQLTALLVAGSAQDLACGEKPVCRQNG
jgi:hypothetical protein